MPSIRDKLKGKTSKLQKRQSEGLGIQPKQQRTYKKALISLETEDIFFLKNLVTEINMHTKRQTSKSELLRLALDLLRQKSLEEILESLKEI